MGTVPETYDIRCLNRLQQGMNVQEHHKQLHT